MIRLYEWLAGKLIVRAYKARTERGGPEDAHEIRHLYAAVWTGNSDHCTKAMCSLDVSDHLLARCLRNQSGKTTCE